MIITSQVLVACNTFQQQYSISILLPVPAMIKINQLQQLFLYQQKWTKVSPVYTFYISPSFHLSISVSLSFSPTFSLSHSTFLHSHKAYIGRLHVLHIHSTKNVKAFNTGHMESFLLSYQYSVASQVPQRQTFRWEFLVAIINKEDKNKWSVLCKIIYWNLCQTFY